MFAKDLGLEHFDAVDWPEHKSVGFILRQQDYRIAYLRVET